jgi:alpha-amylase
VRNYRFRTLARPHRPVAFAALTVSLAATVALPGSAPSHAGVGAYRAAAAGAAPGVIVQMLDWPWPAIASECANVLGPDGYGAVQISPPQEAIVLPADGYPWWQAYQPVAYDLNSRFGAVNDTVANWAGLGGC